LQFVLCLLLFPLARSEFLASAGCFIFDFASASSVLCLFDSRVTTDRGFGHRGKSDFYSVVRQFEGWSKLVALSPLEFSRVACSIWSPSPLNLDWSSAVGRPLLFSPGVLLERAVHVFGCRSAPAFFARCASREGRAPGARPPEQFPRCFLSSLRSGLSFLLLCL
jgi:hypothetical protein